VVLDHHLLYGRRMTLITFQDGKPVLRDGKVGTEQECCCCDPCLVRLCTAYGVIVSDPNDTSFDEWTCGIFANAFLWLKEALESAGWTVSLTDFPPPDDVESACSSKLVAECYLCDVNGPEDGEWLDLTEYVVDHPLPEEPQFNGIPQQQQVFVGSPPIDPFGSFPCDSARGSGFTTSPGICGDKPYFTTMIPICNPLP
jgi:hypothetical protein